MAGLPPLPTIPTYSEESTDQTEIKFAERPHQSPEAAAPEFDHSERDRNKNSDRPYAMMMLFGSPYERLIATNGRPLRFTGQEQEEEQVQARVTRPVRIEGFIAEVEPGTQFEVEKAPISADIWLPTHFVMKSRAKILFFVNYNTEENESYFDYHRPSSNGRVLPLN